MHLINSEFISDPKVNQQIARFCPARGQHIDNGQIQMYTIEHLSDESWTAEVTRETEFKAFVDARTKCMATGKIYRVVDEKHNVRYTITLDACKKQLFSNHQLRKSTHYC